MNDKLPVVFSDKYTILIAKLLRFFKSDLFQDYPIDFQKFEKIAEQISAEYGELHTDISIISDDNLLLFHSKEYLEALKRNNKTAEIILGIEIPSAVSTWVVNRFLIDAARYMASGTLIASTLAMEHGWAINIGGGFHHAKRDMGGGFCFFNDYAIASIKLRQQYPNLKILYIDLDAHLGDGVISFANGFDDFFVFDIYNAFTTTRDSNHILKTSKDGKITTVGIEPYTSDEPYLALLYKYLPVAIDNAKPDFIFYNGGSDVLVSDKLGCLGISPEGLARRDAYVFEEAKKHNIPIAMCLSGGYGKENYKSVANSLLGVCRLMRS